MISIARYLLGLCDAAHESGISFGLATRLGSQNSTFNINATKVIHSLVTFSPAGERIAIEFMQKFQQVSDLNRLGSLSLISEDSLTDGVRGESLLSGQSELDVGHWAQEVLNFLRPLTPLEVSVVLQPVLDLATDYLTHLVAVRNPGGKRTPQVSECPSPQISYTSGEIHELVDQAVIKRNQSALKQLMYLRDGYQCPLTDLSFDQRGDYVVPRCAHILPFSLSEKKASLRIIEAFTGNEISAQRVLDNINHPRNAFNVESNAHDSFDALTWGIEAVSVDGQWKYIFRKLAPSAATIRRRDGDELSFNCGGNGGMIDGPDPEFCNLRLAIARALHACGAMDIIAELYGDNDDDEAITTQPVYFGGPFVSDEVLSRRIVDCLVSYV